MLSQEIREKLPFISIVQYGKLELVGIISNQDQNVTIMYVYTLIEDVKQKQRFLELGRTWWDESNRMVPIDIFLRGEMNQFSKYVITMHTKDVVVVDGPCMNLDILANRRTKRRIIRLG